MNTKITTPQLRCIYALLTKLKLKETDIVPGFTKDDRETVPQLTKQEAIAIIGWLKENDPEEKKAEKQRRYIISMTHELGWRIPGTTKADMKRLDEWMVASSYLHKKLNSYTPKELPKLVTQFQSMYKGYLNKV